MGKSARELQSQYIFGFSSNRSTHHRQDSLTDANYRMFQTMAVEAVVRPWEKAIVGMKFTEVLHSPHGNENSRISQLGAIRFDHDIRAVVTYLSSQTAFSDAREKFQRLQHICTLLNLDMV
jgi:hypothetical protein